MIELDLQLARPGFSLKLQAQLPARGVSALFGPSGCGKTTVLRAMAGLERAAGRVLLDGEAWQDDAAGVFVPTHQRALGYVIQEAALFPHLDVRRNLEFGQRRIPASQRRIALDQVVDLLGIAPLLARRPGTLSGGERQRVAIGRALATSPRLLLMDEPLAALDAARKAELLPYLDRMNQALQIPIVYVTHAVTELAQLADHLVLMEAGRAAAAGALPEMLARLDLQRPLGEDAGVVLNAVVGERDAHWQLARLDIAGGDAPLWSRDAGHALGRGVRVRVLARDVSLTLARQTGTSIANQLPCRIEAIADDAHPAGLLVRVRVAGAGGALLVARLTRRSAQGLGLAPGLELWAQVKTVALLD